MRTNVGRGQVSRGEMTGEDWSKAFRKRKQDLQARKRAAGRSNPAAVSVIDRQLACLADLERDAKSSARERLRAEGANV